MVHKIEIPTPFAVGDVNAYIVKGDALSIVDVGPKTPEAYEALKTGLKEIGYSFKDIEQVILTHHHPDHAGWMEAFDRAEVIGHPYNDLFLSRDPEFIERHDEFYLQCFKEAGVPDEFLPWVKKMKSPLRFMGERVLDRTINEGDSLSGHPDWKILKTLGHAQSHLSFFNEITGELIGGDLLLNKVSSNPLIEPPMDAESERPRSILQYNASLSRLLTLPVKTVYTGHGNEVRNAHQLIESRLRKQKERADIVYGMLKGEKQTLFDLTRQLFPAVYKKELGLTLSETMAQLDCLMHEEMITESRGEGGVIYYEWT